MADLRAALVATVNEAGGASAGWSDAAVEYVVGTNAERSAGSALPWRVPFEQLVASVQSKLSRGPCVYFDTTTIWTAMRLTAGDSSILRAQTLMDLDKLTRAVVLDEHVFHLPSPFIDCEAINQIIGDDVLVPLEPVGSVEALDRVLWDIWYYAAPDVANKIMPSWGKTKLIETCKATDSRHLFADLATFHGLTLQESDWNIGADESARTFSSDPVFLVRHLVSDEDRGENLLITGPGEERLDALLKAPGKRKSIVVDEVHELVHRAVFNQLLADALGLVYDCSFARMPAVYHINKNSKAVALALADIKWLQDIAGERMALTTKALGEASVSVNIPPFTAYALRRVKTLGQWWEVIGEYRERSAKYRRNRKELQEALFVEDVKTISRLRAQVIDTSRGMADEKIDASLDLAADAARVGAMLIPGTPAAFAGPTAQAFRLAIDRPTKAVINALRRRVKPELRLSYDLVETATSCMKLENKIRLLWDIDRLPESVKHLTVYAERSRALMSD